MIKFSKQADKKIQELNKKVQKNECIFTEQISKINDCLSMLNDGLIDKISFLHKMYSYLNTANNATKETIMFIKQADEIVNKEKQKHERL